MVQLRVSPNLFGMNYLYEWISLFLFVFLLNNYKKKTKKHGLNRDLNPGPPAPKAGIIPLDHLAAL